MTVTVSMLAPHNASFVALVPSIYESERAPWKVSSVGSVVNLRTLPATCPGHSTVPVSHSHRQKKQRIIHLFGLSEVSSFRKPNTTYCTADHL